MKSYSPDQVASCMPRMCRSVDFPAPDGPMIETNSPGLISSVMRRRTYVWPGPAGYDFSTLLVAISGALAGTETFGTADNDELRLNMISSYSARSAQR